MEEDSKSLICSNYNGRSKHANPRNGLFLIKKERFSSMEVPEAAEAVGIENMAHFYEFLKNLRAAT